MRMLLVLYRKEIRNIMYLQEWVFGAVSSVLEQGQSMLLQISSDEKCLASYLGKS